MLDSLPQGARAAHLAGLGTALPPHPLPQCDVRDRARALLAPRFPQFDKLEAAFDNAGIESRSSVVPMEWFENPRDWRSRNDAYLRGASALWREAAGRALAEAGWEAGSVDILVTVSSTGIATPTLESLALEEMGFRGDAMRVPLFGLGCAGGVSGLAVAEVLARGRPGGRVLVVAVECCTLSFRLDRLRKADIIATVLFGDGAAAACISTEETPVRLAPGHQKQWPGTRDIMGWQVEETGLGVIFDRSIPPFVTERFAGAAEEALAAFGLDAGEVDRFVCHPGGAKVLDAIERAMHLPQGSLLAEREVLRRAGNMSAPTVLFVLDDVLRAGARGRMVAAALGPGFTASFLPLEAA
jgi:alkylresorcinol/alkylpyrone synthase